MEETIKTLAAGFKTKLKPAEDLSPSAIREYGKRNSRIQDMGYLDYDAYLNSDLWHNIRLRVVTRDRRRCLLCLSRGWIAHHLNYLPQTLKGTNLEGLATLCSRCHDVVERTPKGRKRSPSAARREFTRRRKLRKV